MYVCLLLRKKIQTLPLTKPDITFDSTRCLYFDWLQIRDNKSHTYKDMFGNDANIGLHSTNLSKDLLNKISTEEEL